MIVKLLKLGWVLALGFAALFLAAGAVIAAGAVEAYIYTPLDSKTVEVNQGLFALYNLDKKAPEYPGEVMKIYGLPTQQAIAVVFVPKEKFFHPPEMPDITMLPEDPKKGEHWVQLRAVQFFRNWSAGCAAAVGVVLLVVWLAVRRRGTAAG
jgi:hypothetical protein